MKKLDGFKLCCNDCKYYREGYCEKFEDFFDKNFRCVLMEIYPERLIKNDTI